MTSARQRRANRANSRASTGPTTVLGRARSARNALRHGLRVSLLRDAECAAEIDDLVRSLIGDTVSPQTRALLQKFAEAQVDLVRIKKARHDILSSALDPAYESPRQRKQRSLGQLKLLGRMLKSGEFSKEEVDRVFRPHATGADGYAEGLRDFAKRLAAIDRYEQRAASRLKFAIRELDAGGFKWPPAQWGPPERRNLNGVDGVRNLNPAAEAVVPAD